MTQRLIPILVFLAVIAVGGAVLLVRSVRRRLLEQRLYGQEGNFTGLEDSPAVRGPLLLNTVEQIGRAVSSTKPTEGLRERLAQAGYYDDAAPTIYVGAQLMLGLLALTLGGAVAFSFDLSMIMRICIIVAFLAAFALLPNVVVTLRRRKRTREVRHHLPDAIALLEICVS